MEAILDMFNNKTKTELHNIPSVKEYIDELGINTYEDYESSLNDIFQNIPEGCKELLNNSWNHVNKSHLKYHNEPYGWHALCCGHITSYYSKKFGGDANIGFKLGFLHDIGKPLCESNNGITFGHGQIGSHVADFMLGDIKTELKDVLLFIIDQHMCKCTHNDGDNGLCYEVLSSMISSYTPYQIEQFKIYFKALIMGDRLGKIGNDNMTIEQANNISSKCVHETINCKTIPKASESIVLVMHGSQGCGKSYTSQLLKKKLYEEHNITVGVAERDWIYWMLARRQKLIDNEVTYEDYVNKKILIDGEYITIYRKYYPHLKKLVAESYRAVIDDMKEKYDITIIDSCISLDTQVLSGLITSQDTSLVWNGFPQHMLGRSGSIKINEQVYYPLKKEGSYYRSIIEGANEKQEFKPIVCTSRVNELISIIVKMWNNNTDKTIHELVHPVYFLNKSSSLNELKSNTPYMLVENPLAYINQKYNVVRLSYRDGTQNGNGITINYRGETILQDKSSELWYPLRVSLPVTPETGQMRRFKSHSQVYNYLVELKPFLTREFTTPRYIPETCKYNKCFILPKVDGSLMTAWCVKKDSIQGDFCNLKRDLAGKYLVEVGEYYVGFGSKSCIFLTQTRDYEEEFYNCILGSYSSIEELANKVVEYLKDYEWKETASVIFEMVPNKPHDGLTVDYGRYFTTHLATVLYNEPNTKIVLPNEISKKYFVGVDTIELECNAMSIKNYYEEKMKEALDGKFEDLEGFMLAFTSDDGDLLYVKLKFPWYYAAHKPDSNFREAEELEFDPKYEKIKDRLVNLAISSTMREARRNPDKVFVKFVELLAESIFKFKETFKPVNKKDFMIKFRENAGYFDSYPGIEESLNIAIHKLHINIDYTIGGLLPSLWDKVINLGDMKEVHEVIYKFIMKYWNINNKF
jgi:hypothetical protein